MLKRMPIEPTPQPKRLSQSPRPSSQRLLPTPTALHDLEPGQGLQSTDKNRLWLPLPSRHNIEAPVNPIAKVEVGSPRGAEHGIVPRRSSAPNRSMGCWIPGSPVRLGLHNLARRHLSPHLRDHETPQKISGHPLHGPQESFRGEGRVRQGSLE